LSRAPNLQQIGGSAHLSLVPFRPESLFGARAEAKKRAKETHILTRDEELDATKGTLPSLAWMTFADWASVGAWYRGLTAGRSRPDAAITAKAHELTAGAMTEEDKAKAIYTFVSTKIRYIGVAFGVGRYQPHNAAEVLSNGYGDCKDKHTLLAAMLSAVGLHAYPVLIGAGIRFNDAVPSPAAFNHLITRLPLDGNEILLDSTTEGAPWGALLPGIRDQDALAILASAPATVIPTPANLPYSAYSSSSVTSELDASLTSDSHFVLTFRDDNEKELSYYPDEVRLYR
jgi:hypothetical protein